jgi:predicted DNA-binding protein (MmcQ/YjbR family)
MSRTPQQVIAEVALSLPGTEEFTAHGAPNFRVAGGRSFAMFMVNHHGDGRIAVWLKSDPATQQAQVAAAPRHFFVPPYVGPSGWLGVRLDRGLRWNRVAALVRTAYELVAPAKLRRQLRPLAEVEPPMAGLNLAELDPLQSPAGIRAIAALRKICLALPETTEATQFGAPVWRAGKRAFAQVYADDGAIVAGFWVGVAQQGLMTSDPRFGIPRYMGHNGWIALDVTRGVNLREARALALQSYRHFALQRMIRKLPAETARAIAREE